MWQVQLKNTNPTIRFFVWCQHGEWGFGENNDDSTTPLEFDQWKYDLWQVMACVAVNLGIISLKSLELVPHSTGFVNMTTGIYNEKGNQKLVLFDFAAFLVTIVC